MSQLSLVPHCTKGSSSPWLHIKGTGRVPSVQQTYEHQSISIPANQSAPQTISIHLRKTKHERSALLLSNQTPKLSSGLLNRFLVIFANSWVALPHGLYWSLINQKTIRWTPISQAFTIKHSYKMGTIITIIKNWFEITVSCSLITYITMKNVQCLPRY